MDVAVTGATGRTGSAVLAEADDRRTLEGESVASVAFATARDPPEAAVHGVAVSAACEFELLLERHEPDVVVDFTGPESTVEYANAIATANAGSNADVAFVTGTTGLSDDQTSALRAASESAPVLRASNFARGVHALLDVVTDAVAALPGYDVELVETHHAGKRDAPSGTANAIIESVEAGRVAAVDAADSPGAANSTSVDDSPDTDGVSEAAIGVDRVHGRRGDEPRSQGEVGVHSLRAGNVPGEHEVVLAGNDEELRLRHRTTDRGAFAAGALDAASWLVDRSAGWYSMADVLATDDGVEGARGGASA